MDPDSAEGAAALERARSVFIIVGIVIPVIVAVAASILMLTWLPELPVPAATHWSGAGPDGSGPGWTFPAVMAGLGVGFPLVMGAMALSGARRAWGFTGRFLGAAAIAFTLFLAIGMGASVSVQRGLSLWSDAPETGGAMLIGAVVGIGAGLIAWFVQPNVTVAAPADSVASDALPLAADERAVWIRTVSIAPGGIVAIVLGVIAAFVGAGIVASSGSPAAWVLFAVGVVLTMLVLTTVAFRVRVDASGLTVRSVVGWPSFHIPAADVQRVQHREVSPMAEFGGWGLRKAPGGAFGVVLRAGEGIEVRRTDGRSFVVTVPDAERGARLLATFAARLTS